MMWSKLLVAAPGVMLCLNGCTSYQTVQHKDVGKDDFHSIVRSSCSSLAFEPGSDVKVGDEIRFQTCDGRSTVMTVTELDALHVKGNKETVAVDDLRSLEIKKLSLWKTTLYGLTGGTVALASVALLCGAVIISAMPHLILSILAGG
ncbi:hypothetical protein V4C53_11170 [Paraburkholderia azotifigens]|uniref:hypothetical protein n=1 Tax=Paraburkholderia azotifigens TaxID=2057004 RepID=UPI00316C9026